MLPKVPHPFHLPEQDAEKQFAGILTRTSESPIWDSPALQETPFLVPQGFWNNQYQSILAKTASPRSELTPRLVLRPAFVCMLGALILVGIRWQPRVGPATTINSSITVDDVLSATSGEDFQTLLEEEIPAKAPTSTLLFDEDEILF